MAEKGNITMMNIDPTVLAFRSTAEGGQKILDELEAELADVKARRDRILADISKANDAAVRDQQARLKLPGLNKEDAAAGRLIVSIEHQVSEARKRVAMAENHAAAGAARRAEMTADGAAPDKLFEVVCPDGVRKVRHRAASFEGLRKKLQPGYSIVGQVFGANADDTGGFAASIGSDGKKSNMMDGLLQAHGDILLEWLAQRGIVGSIAQPPEPARLKE
jgi:hypothetical protein